MTVAFHNDPRSFLKEAGDFLKQHQIEHNLMLSLCQHADAKCARGDATGFRGCVVKGEEGIVLAAVQTPPHNLVLSRSAGANMAEVVQTLTQNGWQFSGIVGPSDVTNAFSTQWAQLTGEQPSEFMDQIIYDLKKVVFPPPVEGTFRLAEPAEAKVAAVWLEAFAKDAHLPKGEQPDETAALKKAEELIAARRLAVWDVKGKPVAQAGVFGTEDVARIGAVYTPPEARGHGYASAVVAYLSQQQLEQGKKICCLYADARNPVSNSIYRKIGYEFAARSSMYMLATSVSARQTG